MPPYQGSKGTQGKPNGDSERLQPPASPSRPRSILNVSRSLALSPSLSSQTPLNQLSSSPSNQSVRSTIAGGGGSGSALHRLKRVASNASIASTSSRVPPQYQRREPSPGSSSPQGLANGRPESVASESSSAAPNQRTTGDTQPSDPTSSDISTTTKYNDRLTVPATRNRPPDESSPADTIKRPRSPTTQTDTPTVKQARRKTWFGFGPEVDDDLIMQEAKGKAKATRDTDDHEHMQMKAVDTANVEMKEFEGKKDKAEESKAPAPAKVWLPWRAPNEEGNPSSTPNVHQQQAASSSYTDTIRRYVSAGSQTTLWNGWPVWRTDAQSQGQETQGNQVEESAADTEMAEAEESNDVQAAALSAQPPSMLSRWWPAWGAETAKDEPSLLQKHETKTPPVPPRTPAEQVKADALARLGAKEAVLNDATRSTWINYFSSRSALPPTKMGDMERGPEVMKLELPSNLISSSAVANGPSSKPSSTKSKVRESAVAKDSLSDSIVEKADNTRPRVDPAPPISRPSTPLTLNKEAAKQVIKAAAAANGKGKKGDPPGKPPKGPPPPNLLLPSFDDIFSTAPRSLPPSKGMLEKTLSYLFNRPSNETDRSRARKSSLLSIGGSRGNAGEEIKENDATARLPRLWNVVGDKERAASKGYKGIQKVAIIGVHGWFSKGPLRNLFGEPTGTSIKFASMMESAVKKHYEEAGVSLQSDQICVIALEADGQVADRVNKSFSTLLSNPKWMAEVLAADVVLVAAHSQGSVVATHLLARLIEQRHLNARRQKVSLLAMCGIHHGPFTHLRSSVATYYLNTFETPAAKELFEYQDSRSPVSRMYAASLRIVASAGVKLIYVASMDDQVVPLYSALNSSASHPSIIRAIFCDAAAFPRVDFLTNLLSFCAAVRNAGLSDHNLLTLLSSSVAGSLYGGVGHSIVYEEAQVYSLAVRYTMEVSSLHTFPTTKSSESELPKLILEPFSTTENAKWNGNPYSLPWSLRGLLEDEMVRRYFDPIIDELLNDYNDWTPTTKTLKDVQFRLEPMRLVSRQPSPAPTTSTSKL